MGKLKTAFDANKRVLSSISDHAEEIVPAGGYDGCGNLRQRTLLDPIGLTHFDYSYDDLYQLTSELGSVSNNYTYDSIYNRLSKNGKPLTVNSLNQVLETEEESFTFDADGNPISCITPIGEIFYSYDALDRLTSVTNHGKTTRYAYDSFNRRLIKKADREKYFLYQDANEIGCLEEGYLTEFRVLGDQGLAAEIGCAVAIELQGIAYAPIHDLSGNIIALIDSEGHPYETYRYSSFGEEQIFDASHERLKTAQNPWRFSSKRFDDESDLIYFGRRYYSPSLGRWLTQDPEGFDVSSNLYAYVSNNPLTHFDAYGLFEMDYALPGNMIDYKSVGEDIANLSFAAHDYVIENREKWKDEFMEGISNGFFDSRMTCINKLLYPNRSFPLSFGEDIGLYCSAPLQVFNAPQCFTTCINLVKSAIKISNLRKSEVLNKIFGSITELSKKITEHVSLFKTGSCASKQIWSETKGKNSVENALRHWNDHKNDFPELKNSIQYVRAARKFVSNPPTGTLAKIRNKDVVYYNPLTNIFAVKDQQGAPRTFYKPSLYKHPYKTNLEYFNAQKGR